MYTSANSVVKLQTLITMDPKYYKDTSIKVEPDAVKSMDTLKKYRYRQARSGTSSEKPVSMATMSAPSIQPRFLGICEGMNGHIFNIRSNQAKG